LTEPTLPNLERRLGLPSEVNYSAAATLREALEPPYRSRGEAQVGRVLDRYGMPFFYEQPTLIYDRGRHRIWHPDFSLPTYNGLVVEYAGMMDVPDYARGIEHKGRVYAANEIPAVFVYPEDLAKPGWPEGLVESIYKAAQQPLSPYCPSSDRNIKAGYW